MKKDIVTHFAFFISFFLIITVLKRWFSLDFLPFWIGGLIGTLLPDIDHLIYIYFLKPHELTSQRVEAMLAKGEALKSAELLTATKDERDGLIIHTAQFQVLFLVFAFLIVTSSGNLLGQGLVLAFLIHLLIDQIVDLVEKKNVDKWFSTMPVELDEKQRKWFIGANVLAVVVLAVFF